MITIDFDFDMSSVERRAQGGKNTNVLVTRKLAEPSKSDVQSQAISPASGFHERLQVEEVPPGGHALELQGGNHLLHLQLNERMVEITVRVVASNDLFGFFMSVFAHEPECERTVSISGQSWPSKGQDLTILEIRGRIRSHTPLCQDKPSATTEESAIRRSHGLTGANACHTRLMSP